ncbi:tRNA (cytosine(72)-C(5))-methyltransferase NSUN6 isoform X3 [Cyclopterus lumpus]|uniref:tRNA (cytosine(72)-C(5))-methyltransferase NSUN6 isoform X3 n=1 Tax=Cyclopterus lumpus TaxID=8103 RepID=UPI00148660FC|nr:tRNA (cytosine(72)-C(5))-methyltransferase NSUN6 isoform X3 [Cyclopterus lumpus]
MSFPEAAHMSVSPPLAHLCSGQYSSRSPGRDPTQVGRRAEQADVQLISRGGLRSDSSSPANSRCASPSRRWPENPKEAHTVRGLSDEMSKCASPFSLSLSRVLRPVKQLSSEVVVGAQCGSAVLRGAHVFVPGIVASPKYMKAGDAVSVLSDLEGRCTRGATSFQGNRVFVGNGVAQIDRSSIFCTAEPAKGIGVRMVEPLYQSPSFDGVLPNMAFLQNLPSVVVGHVLGPRPGERILDMCAAPGGKTCHIAALMRDQGEVVALERIRNKIDRIRQNAQMLHLRSIKVYCFNSTRAVSSSPTQGAEGPPFPPESFDRVLLDAPCSGLGQRPIMSCTWSLREICSYQPLQRKLFHAAVRLLKRGGVLVYSTCTVTLAENEEQIAWALETFPCLTLQPQEPHIGAQGMLGAGLSPKQLRLLQRFSPELSWDQTGTADPPLPCRADVDTIGFFIAKFLKN